MKQIIAPIDTKSQPDIISNLQEGLLKIGMVIVKTEIAGKSFGKTTVAAIRKFQEKNKLVVNGEIDAPTAARLNELLKKKGAFGSITDIKPLKGVIKTGLLKRKFDELDKEDAATTSLIDSGLNDYFIESLESEGINLTEPVKAAITAQRIDFRSLEHLPVKTVFSEIILPELAKNESLKKQTVSLSKKISAFPNKKLTTLLRLEKPLGEHPAFQKEIQQTKNAEYAKLVNISSESLGKLAELDIDIRDASDYELDDLVNKKLINASQQSGIQLAGDLGRLTDDNIPLMTALQKKQVKSAADLAKIGKADLLTMITAEKVPLPENTTAEEYADRILENIEEAFPTQVFIGRISATDKKKLMEPLSKVNTLLGPNKKLVDREGSQVTEWQNLSPAEIQTMQAGLQQLTTLANTYQHLGIGELINDASKDVTTKQAVIGKRLDALDMFMKNNPEIELEAADFFMDTADDDREEKINWAGIGDEEKPLVKKQLMAYQRVMDLGDDVVTRSQLLSNGFDSALRIADESEGEFIRKSGLKAEEAKEVYSKATQKAMTAANQFAAMRDVFKGGFKEVGVSNMKVSQLLNDLKDIDGLADLFGSQDYCDCDECRSIFSPAAYFTDLMLFIDKNITNPAFAGKALHPLRLRLRRPDLWNLPLTCKNTNTLIPYLDVVNEILETYLEKAKGIENIFEKVSHGNQKVSFYTPFNLPLEETRAYLDHFSLSLTDILAVLQEPSDDILRERLKLSKEEFDVITEPAVADIEKRYGDLADIKIADVLRFAGITRKNLDELLALKSTDALNALTIEKIKGVNDLQPTGEKFKGLAKKHLDFIHRFVRLWKKLPWSIREFDLVLDSATRLVKKGLVIDDLQIGQMGQMQLIEDHTLSPAIVNRLSILLDISLKLKLNPEELCGLTDILPIVSLKDNQKSFFSRLFNNENLFKGAGLEADYHHYSRNVNDPADTKTDPVTPVLLNGLGISETELVLLFDLLEKPMKFDEDGNTKMDRDKISLLYRHARLAKALKLPVSDMISLVKLMVEGNDLYIFNTARIRLMIESRAWVKTTPFSIAELWFLVKQEASANMQVAGTVEDVIGWTEMIESEDRLSFSAEEIVKTTGIEQADSENVLKAFITNGLASVKEKKFRLLPAWSLSQDLTSIWTSMNASDALKAKENELRVFFNSRHPKNVWHLLLSEMLNSSSAQLVQLAAFLPPELDDAAYFGLLNSAVPNDDPAKKLLLEKAAGQATQLGSYILLFEKLKMNLEETTFILSQPALFSMDAKKINLGSIKALQEYRKLSARKENAGAVLHPLLISLQAEQKFGEEAINNFAKLLDREPRFIRSIVRAIPLSASPFEAITQLLDGMAVCESLGINGYGLAKFKGTSFSACSSARDIMIGSFGTKYADEKQRTEKLEPYKDKINVKKRDMLCGYIIALQKELKFEDHAQLYSYFLLDVEMGGCFRTSRLVAAISSLQLYVHRCLLNLEQSGDENSQISDVNVMASIKTKEWAQLVEEWEWRKNYRVWEANRKVFLYPENYIEPDLRDNKSPLFKELEEELLQQKITRQSAEDAYKKYLTQFAELARLKIAGCYYDGPTNTYYIIGRTHIDPYQYYIRKWKGCIEWTPWEKISVSISAPNVSAVVHLAKLYVFWVDVNVREKNNISNGNSEFDQYEYTVFLNYSYQNENGKWSSPQKMPGLYDFDHKDFVVPEDVETDKLQDKIQKEIDMLNDLREKISTIITDLSSIDARINQLENQLLKLEAEEDVHEIALQENKEVEDVLRFYYEHSKTYRKCYPLLLNKSICLEYIWMRPWVELFETGEVNPMIFGTFLPTGKENSLNLFHNQLEQTSLPHEDEKRRFLKTRCNDKNAALILRKYGHFTEGRADAQLEVYGSNSSDIKLTENFSYSTIRPEIATVNSSFGDYILVLQGQSFLVRSRKQWRLASNDGAYKSSGFNLMPASERILIRLSTTLADRLGTRMFTEGIDAFLSLSTQRFTETASNVSFLQPAEMMPGFDHPTHIDFNQSYGEYYRELFFHIPFLIANHLNANGKFKEAKYWYEKIFDPTANEDGSNDQPTERNWQYIEFRNLHIDTLKEILTDEAAIAKYKEDPFNPHAIARLRLNAYQKSIVMKYIDNLVDWGDQLFTQDTMESINEATMLYILAADILGKRPASLGKCETVPESALTYNEMKDDIEKGSEFLIQLENWNQSGFQQVKTKQWKGVIGQMKTSAASSAANSAASNFTTGASAASSTTAGAIATATTTENASTENNLIGSVKMSARRKTTKKMKSYGEMVEKAKTKKDFTMAVVDKPTYKPSKRFPGMALIQQSRLAFCIPPNYDLHKYWDRVEDRLFKIRNCMNIDGIRRQLALFQPPIDPMMLVRAKAAGLSLDDVLAMLSAQLPAYRFPYLLEKAKNYVITVQSFGTSLLAAMEKKDTEELTLLKSLHEQNILKLMRNIKLKNIEDAKSQLLSTIEARTNVYNKYNHYSSLIGEGLSTWEVTQQVSKHIATAHQAVESVLRGLAGITYLIPQIGSPFSLKWGGKEMADSMNAFADVARNGYQLAEAISASAGLEASFQRREEEWKLQQSQSAQELKVLDQQIIGLEIKVAIAEKDLEVQDKQIEQTEEVHEFFKNKFTNLGLYTHLTSSLNRLYRQAYNMAHDMARMTEQAYRFECDDTTFFVGNDNWQYDRAGLLAGEKLLLQLQQMEKMYMEKNLRDKEITQTFSMQLLAPEKIVELRQTGSCELFEIPEMAFDLFYPGHYKRIIKSVRITIPCIAGPYSNISCKLSLIDSKVRKEPDASAELLNLTAQKLTSIATSTAQNDSGLFELSFRDERYLPFEGAGAISSWKLELPSRMRTFDYNSISDVIFHISYTAKDDGLLKDAVEENIETAITTFATDYGLFRLFSMKNEFPEIWHRLQNGGAGSQPAEMTLSKNHFPYLFSEKDISLTEGKVYLKPVKGETINAAGMSIKLNSFTINSWADFPEGGLPDASVLKLGSTGMSGDPVKKWTIEASGDGFNKEAVEDMMVLLRYTIN